MKKLFAVTAGAAMLAMAGAAYAQTGEGNGEGEGETPAAVSTGPIPVTGNVPALCSFGQINTDVGPFALGTLIDTTTGLLRGDLDPPAKTVVGSWCNAQSTLEVSAQRLTATNFTGPAPTGFSTGVDFVAHASGWTPSEANYSTATGGVQASATQTQSSPNATTITLDIDTFATQGGATLRPVADESYLGSVTLTLTPVS